MNDWFATECGEPPASGARVCRTGAQGGMTRAGANYVASVANAKNALHLFEPHDGQHKCNGLVYFFAQEMGRKK